jgi:DNA-binding NarL/FixJ family response regulator
MLTMYHSYQTAAREAGADAFLVKGCSADELVNAIRNYAGSESNK